MHVGGLGRVEHILIAGIVAHPADVGLDGCGEQLHILRQVADALAELARIPVAQVHHVEPDAACGRDDGSDQHARQHGLPGAGISDDGERFSGLQLKADSVEDHLLVRRRHIENALDVEVSCGTRQPEPLHVERRVQQQGLDPGVGGTRLDEAAPAFDGAFQRRQRAARHDRGGDDHAAGDITFQRQPCAPAEDADLGAQPQELRKPRHQDVAVLRDHLRLQGLHGFAAPHLHAFRNHAHRIDDLGVAGHRFRRQVRPGAVSYLPG